MQSSGLEANGSTIQLKRPRLGNIQLINQNYLTVFFSLSHYYLETFSGVDLGYSHQLDIKFQELVIIFGWIYKQNPPGWSDGNLKLGWNLKHAISFQCWIAYTPPWTTARIARPLWLTHIKLLVKILRPMSAPWWTVKCYSQDLPAALTWKLRSFHYHTVLAKCFNSVTTIKWQSGWLA